VICVVYVYDLIFWSKDVPLINGVAMQLRELGVDLEQEDDAADFLGVTVTLDRDGPSGLLEMKQTGLIKRVIEALGLDDGYAKGKHTPAESKPLVKDADGEGAHGGFSYSSVVGMLLYLSCHTQPNIAYAVNCCARYMFCPKQSHELAMKCIGRYLKQTSECGMIMNPSTDICKIDADFAGMYGHEGFENTNVVDDDDDDDDDDVDDEITKRLLMDLTACSGKQKLRTSINKWWQTRCSK